MNGRPARGPAPAEEQASRRGGRYRQELGLFSVVFLAIGAILGPAVGFTPVSVLALAGPSGLFSWIIAFLLIFAVAMSYVELGTMWPRSGGVAYYPAKSSGPVVGVMNAWGSFVGYALAVPSIIVAFVEYLSFWFPGLFAKGTLTPLGIGIAILVTLIVFYVNTLRIKHLGLLNNILTIVTIIGLLVFIGALLAHFDPGNYSNFGGLTPFGGSGLFLAISATIYGYGGFRQPVDYAEEVKDPGRTIPRAVAVTLVVTMIIYALESLAFAGGINWSGMGIGAGDWAKLNGLPYPLATVSTGVGLVIIGLIALVTTLIASFKDGYIYYGGSARVGHTLARYDRYLPMVFARMSAKGIPIAATILVLCTSFAYLILLPSFSSLFPLVASALLLSYAPGPLSLAIFRSKYPDEARPYRLPFYKVLAPWAFVVSSVMIYWSGWQAIHILIPSVFVGLLLLFFYNHHRRLTLHDVACGIWLPVYLIVIIVLSYVGSGALGGRDAIPFPWDTVVFAAVAVAFYFAGYYSGLRYTGDAIFEDEEPAAAEA
ncbi:MAG: APC family permease [Streptosporangiaceae bacterium]